MTLYYLSELALAGSLYEHELTAAAPVGPGNTGWSIQRTNMFNEWVAFPSWAPLFSASLYFGPSLGRNVPMPNPSNGANTMGGGYRTAKKLTGKFLSQTGMLNVRLHSDMHTYSTFTFTGRLTARMYKGAGPDAPAGAEISGGLQTSTQFTLVNNATADVQIPLTFPPDPTFNNEYMFLVMAIEVDSLVFTPIGTGALQHDVIFNLGVNSSLLVPNLGTIVTEYDCAAAIHPEMYIYISPDGEQYPLDVDGSRVVLNDQGTGTPPFEYVTQRGPFQHGESLVDFHARPRVVQLMINQSYDNRGSYWNGRRNLLKQLSPRKQTVDGDVVTGVLRRILSTGEKRDLNCMIVEGPKFEPRHENAWQEHSYTEALRFQAFDPIYFDPKRKQYNFDRQGSQLVFPAIFPITFTTLLQDVLFQYAGSWLTYPLIVMNGPLNFFHLVNVTTGEKIDISYDLKVGEKIEITLQYGNKTVTKNDGTNLMPYVSSDSDIGTFHLTEASAGLNQLHLHMTGVSSGSQVIMYWYDKYVGL